MNAHANRILKETYHAQKMQNTFLPVPSITTQLLISERRKTSQHCVQCHSAPTSDQRHATTA